MRGKKVDMNKRIGIGPVQFGLSYGLTHKNAFVSYYEKSVVRNNVNAGIYILEHKALSLLQKEKYCDMPTLFAHIKDSGLCTIVYPMHESWLDVGCIEDLQKA